MPPEPETSLKRSSEELVKLKKKGFFGNVDVHKFNNRFNENLSNFSKPQKIKENSQNKSISLSSNSKTGSFLQSRKKVLFLTFNKKFT